MKSGALSFQHVKFAYQQNHRNAVNDFSLELPEGQITAVLGPNGAGKTTFINLILGILKPAFGNILLDGKPLDHFSSSQRSRRIGLVPQADKTTLNFSVLEFVLLGRSPYLSPMQMPTSEDISKAEAVLRSLALSGFISRSVTSLSGGEHQMVMIARALTQETPILLLDEPTAHLDLGNKHKILNILKSLQEQGKTMLFTTHDPNEAAYAADFAVLMKEGQLQKSGSAEDVLNADELSSLYGVEVLVETIGGKKAVVLP